MKTLIRGQIPRNIGGKGGSIEKYQKKSMKTQLRHKKGKNQTNKYFGRAGITQKLKIIFPISCFG